MKVVLGLILGALGLWLYMHGVPSGLRQSAGDQAAAALDRVSARADASDAVALGGGFRLVHPPRSRDLTCLSWQPGGSDDAPRGLACPDGTLRQPGTDPIPFDQATLGDDWRAALLVLENDRQVVCIAHAAAGGSSLGCAAVGGERWSNAWPRVGAARTVAGWDGMELRRVAVAGGDDLACLRSADRSHEAMWCGAIEDATREATPDVLYGPLRIDGWAAAVLRVPGLGRLVCALHETGGTSHAQGAIGCAPWPSGAVPAGALAVTSLDPPAPADGWSRLCIRIGSTTVRALRRSDGGDAAGLALFARGKGPFSCPEAAGSAPRTRTR